MAILLSVVAWLLTYLMHSTVLLGGACVLFALGVVRTNAARDTLWKVALVGGLLTATAQLALRVEPYGGNAMLTPTEESAFIDVSARGMAPPAFRSSSGRVGSTAAPALVESQAGYGAGGSAAGPEVREAAPAPRFRRVLSGVNVSWPASLLHLWFFGALAFGMRLVVTRGCLARRLRARRVLTDGPLVEMLDALRASGGVRRPVRLSVSEDIAGPIAFGGSEIVLPARALDGLAPAEQRAVLAHELGHLVRRDPAWLALSAVIESLFFLQPLNRVARRRLQETAEYLCDDWAADRTGGGLVLAKCLAEVATWMKGAPRMAVAGMAENRSHLVARVQRLLDGTRPGVRRTTWAWRAAIGAGALAMVAWAAPGVAAGDMATERVEEPRVPRAGAPAPPDKEDLVAAEAGGGEGWMSIREGGRLLVLHQGYSVRLRGRGRIAFRQWGRAFELPDGYTVQVNGDEVTDDREVCDRDDTLRIVNESGETAWQLEPVRMRGAPAYAERTDTIEDLVENALRRVRVRTGTGDVDVDLDRPSDVTGGRTVTIEDDAELDAAIDTLVRAWVQDPESVNRAARRLARRVERLEPALSQLGETLGQQIGERLAPQLESLGTDVARELAPAVARLGADLGRSIVTELGAPTVAGEGSRSRKPKHR